MYLVYTRKEGGHKDNFITYAKNAVQNSVEQCSNAVQNSVLTDHRCGAMSHRAMHHITSEPYFHWQ